MTKKLPYAENHALMDGRLVICGLAVGIAMFALAWDFLHPFPKVSSNFFRGLYCIVNYLDNFFLTFIKKLLIFFLLMI